MRFCFLWRWLGLFHIRALCSSCYPDLESILEAPAKVELRSHDLSDVITTNQLPRSLAFPRRAFRSGEVIPVYSTDLLSSSIDKNAVIRDLRFALAPSQPCWPEDASFWLSCAPLLSKTSFVRIKLARPICLSALLVVNTTDIGTCGIQFLQSVSYCSTSDEELLLR